MTARTIPGRGSACRVLARRLRCAAAVASILGAAACGGSLPSEDRLAATRERTSGSAGDVDGRLLFENTCGACHDRSGLGRPGQGPSLRESTVVAGPPDILIRVVLDGVRSSGAADGAHYILPMPSWRVIGDRDVAAIVSHVRRMFGDDRPAVSADDVADVRRATAGRSRPWSFEELDALSASSARR